MSDTPPPAWHASLPAEHQSHIAAKGWDKLEPAAAAVEAAKAHFEAQRFIGHPADRLLKLPADASDPSYQEIYNRVVGMGLPSDPAAYKFEGVDEAIATTAREIAVANKLPVSVAQALAKDLATREAARGTKTAEEIQALRGANDTALRMRWNTDYAQKRFTVQQLAEQAGLPASFADALGRLPVDDHVKTMDFLASVAAQQQEATILRGGQTPRDPTAGMTAEQAQTRLNELKGDFEWGKKFLSGDVDAVKLFDSLTRLVAGARVPQR